MSGNAKSRLDALETRSAIRHKDPRELSLRELALSLAEFPSDEMGPELRDFVRRYVPEYGSSYVGRS